MIFMKETQKGYWIYSIITIIFFIGLFAFVAYLLYDLVIKLATTQISNDTLIQSLITLIITVFIGGYFSKYLEHRNNKRLETYKTQKEIALNIINLMGMIIYNNNKEQAIQLLVVESYKVKLFFDDELLKSINSFCQEEDTNKYNAYYIDITDKLKKFF